MAAAPKIMALITEQPTELLQAADIVTALLKHTRTKSLADLYAKIERQDEDVTAKLATISLSENQIDLIESHGVDLALLRNLPSANLVECPVCGAVSVVSGLASRKCNMKLGCEGTPVKSSSAKKVPAAEFAVPPHT